MNVRSLPVLAGLALMLHGVATDAQAQGRARGRRYNKAQVERTIRRAEDSGDLLRKTMNATLDKSVLDGTRLEDNINDQAHELENALDRLRKHFDRTDAWRETRQDMQEVLNEARDVDRLMDDARWRRKLETEWLQLRRELNTLAGVYNLVPIH